ncbi:MAG: DNA-directed RNA polymerase subunit omega [Actinomycetota bacterium]
MIEPKIENLLKDVDSKYTLVILAARRSRQINSYFSQLGEGVAEFVPPQIPMTPNSAVKALSVAMQEISEGFVSYERTEESA